MEYIVGVDIGNSSTEVALGARDAQGNFRFVASALTETTGIKGTKRNLFGIYKALNLLVDKAGIALTDLSMIRINEATPVIGDVAMETITETIITESTMIGHNPTTPGGLGIGVMAGALTMPHSSEEVIYTIIGVGLVALGHDLNRRALI